MTITKNARPKEPVIDSPAFDFRSFYDAMRSCRNNFHSMLWPSATRDGVIVLPLTLVRHRRISPIEPAFQGPHHV